MSTSESPERAAASADAPSSPGGGILDWFSARLNLTEIFSFLTSFGLFYAEVDNRKPLREALGRYSSVVSMTQRSRKCCGCRRITNQSP